MLNFFATQANAERWFPDQSYVRGWAISMDDAIAAGRAVFGNVFVKGCTTSVSRRPQLVPVARTESGASAWVDNPMVLT